MYSAFTRLLNVSLTAGILAAVIIVVRLFLRKLPKKYFCILWAIVALRLVCPISISSSLSAYNLVKPKVDTSGQVAYFQYNEKSEKPQLLYDLPALVDDAASPDSMSVGTETSGVYLPTLMALWACGVAIMLSSAAVSYCSLKKTTAASVRYKRQIYLCDDIASPFILGIIRPRIYLPSGLDAAIREYVIEHERAHLQRHDHWWKPLGYVLLSVHWFNPVLWAAYIVLCRDIEGACDEEVVADMDRVQIAQYSQALLTCAVQKRTISACPVAFGETDVKGRIRNVLNYHRPAFWVTLVSIAACVITAVCFLTNPLAQSEPEEKVVVPGRYTYSGSTGNPYILELNEDGTFRYIEGDFIGYIGTGQWEFDGERVTLTDINLNPDRLTHFVIDGTSLIFDGESFDGDAPDMTDYIAPGNGAVFHLQEDGDSSVLDSLQAAIPFAPEDIRDLMSAQIHEKYGDFTVEDPDALRTLEWQLGYAEEITEPNCPFGTVLYLYRKDGTVGTIEPAEDSCSVFRANGKYYQIRDEEADLFAQMGVQQNFDRAEISYEGDHRIVTIRHYWWYREEGTPTVAVFDKSNRLICRENAYERMEFEFNEAGYCTGYRDYYVDENGNVHDTPDRVFTYVYDDGEFGFIRTVRDDAKDGQTVFEFDGGYEQEAVIQGALICLPEAAQESITNLTHPFVARVSPPYQDLLALESGFEPDESSLTRLGYLVGFRTRNDGFYFVHLDSQSRVLGIEK